MQIHCQYSQLVPVKELKVHPKNRNKHPEDQVERLARILEYQGWRYPIKVSKLSGFITSGHGRLAAAKLLKLKEVPVSFQDYADETQEYADLQADNAIASWSHLDFAAINAELVDLGPDFDIDLLGIRNFLIEPAEKFDATAEWAGMPDFENPNNCHRKIIVNFADEESVKKFFALIQQADSGSTKSIWYPYKERRNLEELRWDATSEE